MELTAIISGVIGIIAVILKLYVAGKPKRDMEKDNEATQRGRSNISNGNIDNVNVRIDKLLSVPDDTTSYYASGQHDTSDLLRRTQAVTGADILPDRAGSTGSTVGESGRV